MKQAHLRNVIATIDLNALRHNILTIRQTLSPQQKFYAVVKANAYGHGATVIAKAAETIGVDGFCVALLDEALELRAVGITKPILVMGLTLPQHVPLAIDNDIMLTVSDASFLNDSLPFIVDKPLHIHIAIDTGMNRIGVNTKEQLRQMETVILTHPHQFVVDGMFTHFATADGENDNFVQKQYDRFETFINDTQLTINNVHLANSAMTLWRSQFSSQIVRIGIAMYGLNPSDFALHLPLPLKPVLTLHAEVVYKHLLKKGESVSYGAKYSAKQDEYVGTLPIGYADGWLRAYASSGVYIDGQKCDVLGVICMDQMMIRLPEHVEIGQTVELIGEHQSASDIAVAINTIGYEVLCGLSNRIKREYKELI